MLDTSLKLFGRTAQLDEKNFSPRRLNNISVFSTKSPRTVRIKCKGEDQTVQICSNRPFEDFEPNHFSQFDERWSTKIKD
jgi:hypothetical protein